MSQARFRTEPEASTSVPRGIPFIVGNEMAERFSFYGMYMILADYTTRHLTNCSGQPDYMTEAESNVWIHSFNAAAYSFPLLGAILSDWLLGKYRTILWISILYCLGHLALSTVCGRDGLFWGMLLIAMGAGGIKPCVSAHVGDQFGTGNQHLQTKTFGWFYFAINFGAFLASVLSPVLLTRFGPHVAFGLPGILMLIATAVFWSGRYRYAHIPAGGTRFLRKVFSLDGLYAVLRLLPTYAFVSIFWALHDQTGSTWIHQGNRMEREVGTGSWAFSIEAAQLGATNPILVMLFIPLFSQWLLPALERRLGRISHLSKVSAGFVLGALAFVGSGMIETQLLAGNKIHLLWQILPYIILTAGEVLVYGTCLEFSYSQAPNELKSFVMSIFLLTIAAGNMITAGINASLSMVGDKPWLAGANYHWFFAALMAVAWLLFMPVVLTYKPKDYIQGTDATPAVE